MILLIDDDKFGMKSYILTLEGAGFVVETATRADEALLILARDAESIELIILDVMLPSGEAFTDGETDYGLKTGRILLKHLLKLYPHLPVLVFSITDSTVMGSSLGAAQVEFLSKVDTLPTDLLERVRRRLQLLAAERTAPEGH